MKHTWIDLDLDVLTSNLTNLRDTLNNETEIIFVVKSNAYSHGMITIASHAWKQGVKSFAVAHINEALELRASLPEAKIIIVGVLNPEDAATAAENKFIPIIVSKTHAASLSKAIAEKPNSAPLNCHAKIDTGMGRLGFTWETAADDIAEAASMNGLNVCGLCTHFASSDSKDKTFTNVQEERFHNVVAGCEERGLSIDIKHVANSGAITTGANLDMDGVRPGIMLYGYNETSSATRAIETKPFLHWKTRIVQVRNVPAGFSVSYDSTFTTSCATKLATIDVGYADGYPRLLSNKGHVLIGGKRCPVVGRVTMNLIAVDLGSDSDAKESDEVVLIGTQGDESIWADELAKLCDTIPYEILTNIK